MLEASLISAPLCKCCILAFQLDQIHGKTSLGLFHAFWHQGTLILYFSWQKKVRVLYHAFWWPEKRFFSKLWLFHFQHHYLYISKCLKFPPPPLNPISIESSLTNFNRQNDSKLCVGTAECSPKGNQPLKEMLTLMVKSSKLQRN